MNEQKAQEICDKIFHAFRNRQTDLYHHIHLCLIRGTPIPPIQVRWDEQTQDIVMEICGE